MAIAHVQEFPIQDRSTTNLRLHRKPAGLEADGLILHTAGFDDDAGVFRIFDVWQSQEHAQRFQDETVMPLVNELLGDEPGDFTPPSRDGFYELHHVAGM